MMPLDFTVLHRTRHEQTLSIDADPGDTPALERVLAGWLEGNGWHKGRWGEFSAEVRHRDGIRVVARVRVA